MIKDNNDGTFSIVAPCSFEKPKPLNDDEIKAIENSVKYSELALSNDEYMLKFARAIEERHGIK